MISAIGLPAVVFNVFDGLHFLGVFREFENFDDQSLCAFEITRRCAAPTAVN